MHFTKNYYELLNIPRDAGGEEIRRAYHHLARQWHPDRNPDAEATSQFVVLQHAYEILSDPARRLEYDNKLNNESNEPVLADISYSRQRLAVQTESQLVYALLDLSAAPKMAGQASPNVNLCLVLDHSTSMHGARLDTVKAAAIELIRQTKAEDVISVVAFSDRAEVLVKSGKNTDRHFMETQIQMMRDGGGTEIFQGLEMGFQEVQRHLNRTMVNHIFIITDGHTYGDEANCLQLADRAAQLGVRITCLGIGVEWNDKFIDDLTSRTGGGSFFIAKTEDLRPFMRQKFDSLRQVFAERVALSIEMPAELILSTAFRVCPDTAILPPSNQIHLGSIQKNSGLTMLFEFIIPAIHEEAARYIFATGEIRLVLPFDAASVRKIPLTFSRLTGANVENEAPPPELFSAITQLTLYRMQEKAALEVAEGKMDQASLRLQNLATQLFSLGETALAQTALMEADRIRHTHMLSAEGKKSIKYGTRSFLLPSKAREGKFIG